ncbi:hypothetical protein [Reichenbachiella ulvae]|uniref:Por secretion system C-terminal sorting domain-containing protein n=1 Tax=Reichenbachiella ulvae TaxID=2980104 RepID=A0ABT3CSA3_9BACT|nr:hypothetical protein [Reichenbachiella ulvae]MCV9386497.1 hypothetical protein [Reichenbachiella ulvae]
MKLTIPIFAFFVLCLNVQAADTLNINNAVLKRKITVAVSGNGGLGPSSAHFQINSLSSSDLNILIPAGLMLYSDDPQVQDLIILQEDILVINARSTYTYDAFGACTQLSNHSPKKEELYKLGQLGQKEWVQVAQIVAQNDLQSSLGQAAIWALSDNATFDSFDSNHVDASWDIAKIIAIYKKENPPALEEIQTWTPAENRIIFSSRADLPYHAPKDMKARLFILDSTGQEVKEVFDYKKLFAGLHIYTIGLNRIVENQGSYIARLINEDGKVLKEITLANNQEYVELKAKQQTIQFEFIVRQPSKITLSVYDTRGELVQEIFKDKPLPLSKRNTNFKLIHAMPTGEPFEIRVSNDQGEVIHSMMRKAN